MRLSEVPQDEDPTLQGERKLLFAVDAEGLYQSALTTGWSAEETVKALAWKVLDEAVAQARQQVLDGQRSPLFYFMKLRQMDLGLLAQNMGVWSWRIRGHLRPEVFARLSPQWLQRYSECLDIPLAQLRKGLPDER